MLGVEQAKKIPEKVRRAFWFTLSAVGLLGLTGCGNPDAIEPSIQRAAPPPTPNPKATETMTLEETDTFLGTRTPEGTATASQQSPTRNVEEGVTPRAQGTSPAGNN